MSHPWRFRAYSTDEAAALAGMKRGTLDQWIARNPGIEVSAKRKSRRLFSPADIAALAVALELERHGWQVPQALVAALLVMSDPPAPDALLLGAGRGTITISAADLAALQIDQSKILIPVGRIAHQIIAATAA